VRPARLRDDAALAELDATAWSAESGFPSVFSGRGARFFTASNPPDAHLVAEAAGRVVGFVRLKPPSHLPENAHVIQVQGLAVHPAARRRGIAEMLLSAAEQRVRDQGMRKLSLRVLSTNQAAISLYERLGFAREGHLREEFFINGSYVDDILMAKYLTPPAVAPPLPDRKH
jgi:ribosomal protein S18 acetylase RimI-like enzyme